MSLFNKISYPLYSPDDTLVNTNTGDLSKDDVIDFLNTDDDTTEEVIDLKPKKEVKTKDANEEEELVNDDKTDELDEIEDELKEPTDDDLEITLHVSRREIKTKYPTFFKEFPSVEKALYREQAFTEVFPTVADAKDAYSKADTLNRFETDLGNGNIEDVLKAVKGEDPNAFNKIVDNYLPTLLKLDDKAYYHVVGQVFQSQVSHMINEANKAGDTEEGNTLKAAARIFYQFTFGTTDFKPLGKLATEATAKDNSVDKERESYNEQRFNDARTELGNKVSNIIKGTIDQHIDPNDSMSEYVRKTAVKDALGRVDELIRKDSRFKAILDKAWEYAAKNGYNQESKDKIRQATLSKAKTILPTVIKQIRAEALKGTNKRTNNKEDDEIVESEVARKANLNRPKDKDKSTVNRSGGNEREQAKQIPRGTRTLDFLMKD